MFPLFPREIQAISLGRIQNSSYTTGSATGISYYFVALGFLLRPGYGIRPLTLALGGTGNHAFRPTYTRLGSADPDHAHGWCFEASCYPQVNRGPMPMRAVHGMLVAPAAKCWSRLRARCICPRRHLRVLPIRTRPSLFGGD